MPKQVETIEGARFTIELCVNSIRMLASKARKHCDHDAAPRAMDNIHRALSYCDRIEALEGRFPDLWECLAQKRARKRLSKAIDYLLARDYGRAEQNLRKLLEETIA